MLDGFIGFRSPCSWLLCFGLGWSVCASIAQSVPPERPRSRPPSELTGWADWEKGEELLRRIQVPPAPPLSPEAALKTFRVAPGYRLELVASEPMVQNPIFFEFDPEGRIWVVEYQGYMRDLKGSGEGDPICRVVVLEDTNDDGRADRSTVFLDKLVMPRSLAFVKGGVLVAEPPKLWFCRDTNGDLRCDEKTLAGSYGHAGNPQHTANGLRYGLDNWLHSSDSPKRHRFRDGNLTEQATVHRGQFGVTFDDTGRFMTCYESSALHADLIPAEYLLRNRNYLRACQRGGGDRRQFGVNVNIAATAQEVFPIRVTPQITLGALELRDDGRLRTYTVVAGSCFYNGHQFPDDAYGNVFVPEAGGHLIGRLKLSGELDLKATRFYPAEQEFLASTDERFRPVNSRVGPDGALYIADMYHGIIEHVIFFVPWLERQIKERRLEEGLDMGRIYRVLAEHKPIDRKAPRLSSASTSELAGHLNHANGWWRLTAQRLLVERNDPAAIPLLRELASGRGAALGRVHALWTLEGMGALDWPTIQRATADADPRVRATAVRVAENGLHRSGNSAVTNKPATALPPDFEAAFFSKLTELAGDSSELVRLQVLLSTGAIASEPAFELMKRMIASNEHYVFRSATLTGLQGRELEFLNALLDQPDWKTESAHRRQLVWMLSQAITDENVPERLSALLALLERQENSPWPRDAIVEGMLAAIPRDLQRVTPVRLPAEPAVLNRLAKSRDAATRERALRLAAYFTWPGAPALRPEIVDVRPLSSEEQRLVELGQEQFHLACAACHQPHGGGLPNVAPPLAGSDWVHGPEERLVRIVLHGLYGPIGVNGQTWNLHMPGFASALSDEQIAGVLSYVRRAWGNSAAPLSPSLVADVRRQTLDRAVAWSAEELTGAPTGLTGPESTRPIIRPGHNGEFLLPARLASTFGRQLAYRPSLDILAPWRHEQDVAEWRLETPSAGNYEVFVTLAADEQSAGDRFIIETERSRTSALVQSSGGYDQFREFSCGTIALQPGLNRIILRPDGPLKRELADVRALRLSPR